ncbi:MAG: cation transporter [Acidimicrobiia bacterium]
MTQVSLQVPEVHCDHCKTSIEGAVSQLPGIETVDVAISDASVTVDYDEDTIDLEQIKSTIEEQGYAVFG